MPRSVIPKLALLIALAVLAQSLTGNPGVTAAPPAGQFIGNGICLLLGAIALVFTPFTRSWPRARMAMVLLCLLSLLSCNKSLAPYLSDLSCASLAGFAGAFLCFDLAVTDRRLWRGSAVALSSIALVSCLHGLAVWNGAESGTPLKSTFTNPDCYSVIPLLGGMLSLSLAVELVGMARWLFAASFLVQLTALMLTASRAGAVAMAVAYSGMLFTLAASRSAQLRGIGLRLFLLPTALLLSLILTGSNLPLFERWDLLAQGQDPVAIKSRWDVVRHGYRTVLRSPWLGWGPGCFALAYQQDRPPLAEQEDYMNVAHNDYMQWFVETGLVGGLTWIGLLAFSALGAWRCYRCPTPWVGGAVGATVGVATYTALNFACPVPADFLWIGASLGLTASLDNLNPATDKGHFLRWNPKIFPVALLLGLGGIWTVRLGMSTASIQRITAEAEQAAASLDWESAIALMQPVQNRQPENYPLHLALAGLYRRAAAFHPRPDWSESQGQALAKAHQASPRDLQILLALITYLQEQKRYEEATKYLTQAELWAPYSPHIQRAKVRNLILTGEILEATKTLARSERTGQVADDAALADLVFLLEYKSPQSGSRFLSQIYSQNTERARQLGLNAAHRAQELQEYPVALRLLKQLSSLTQNHPEILLEIGLTHGMAGESKKELSLLNRLRQNPLDLDPALLEKVWRRWAQLQVAQGDLQLVATELEDYLITHPRQTWAREALCEIYGKQGKNSEARAALRSGLAYDQEGRLRIRLGDLCAEQGLIELARGYYREALPLSPLRQPIEERLKKLGKPSQEEEL